MKMIKYLIPILVFLASCKPKDKALVSQKYIDSLMNISTLSNYEKQIETDLKFWKNRLDINPDSYTNLQNYASTLISKFHLYGNINDVKNAENIILKLNQNYKGTESGLFRTLANLSSLQHRFQESNALVYKALQIGDNKYESTLLLFDSAFELGKITDAKRILNGIKKNHEYAYYFRLAKLQHYDGALDKAIESMEKACTLTLGNIYLQQKALSNLGDLYLHAGNYEQANENYLKSIALDHADYHSLKGLGIIAQQHDKNYALAAKVFRFITQKNQSPDLFYNLTLLAQATDNKVDEQKYATQFAKMVSDQKYGNMYNKYLLELYDGPLKNPQKMLEIAKNEIANRSTPQTNSWYAWALYQNNRKAEALSVYKNKVEGKPLEGLELYFMGSLLNAEGQSFNAKQYFAAAHKNRFELTPQKRLALENLINI